MTPKQSKQAAVTDIEKHLPHVEVVIDEPGMHFGRPRKPIRFLTIRADMIPQVILRRMRVCLNCGYAYFQLRRDSEDLCSDTCRYLYRQKQSA